MDKQKTEIAILKRALDLICKDAAALPWCAMPNPPMCRTSCKNCLRDYYIQQAKESYSARDRYRADCPLLGLRKIVEED